MATTWTVHTAAEDIAAMILSQLSEKGRLLVIDKDTTAIADARQKYDERSASADLSWIIC